MAKTIKDYESEGFSVKKKPTVKASHKKTKEPKAKIVKVPSYDDRGLMSETQKTNHVMHMAVGQIAETMKKMQERPKKLVCQNIVRDTRGLMESFEIVVVE